MAAYDLEEQEKLAELKAWWKQYGNLIVAAVALGLLVVAGVRGWDWYKRSQSVQASVMYFELQKAAGTNDAKKVRDLAGTVLEQYPRSVYAPLAALLSAKVHFDTGDLKTAGAQLQWVIDKADDPEIQSTARVRLARVLLDEKAYDDALKVLDAKPAESFEASFADTRGDIFAAQGKKSEARAAYGAALEKIPATEPAARQLVQLKLDALGSN